MFFLEVLNSWIMMFWIIFILLNLLVDKCNNYKIISLSFVTSDWNLYEKIRTDRTRTFDTIIVWNETPFSQHCVALLTIVVGHCFFLIYLACGGSHACYSKCNIQIYYTYQKSIGLWNNSIFFSYYFVALLTLLGIIISTVYNKAHLKI